MSYVIFENVCKYYHMGDQTIAASDHVTFHIEQGEFCIIVGPSGALDYRTGKTILKLLQDCCRQMNKTVIIVTHNQALTPMADRVIRIHNGSVASIEENKEPLPVEQIEW